LSSRRWVLSQDRLTRSIRTVARRFVTLDTSTLGFPAPLLIQGLTASKLWYEKCLSMMRT
jgi:hypothetical protein